MAEGGGRLTPTLQKYVTLLGQGYRIEVRSVANTGWPGTHKQPKLVGPHGAVVQSVRWDTYRRLLEALGVDG